MVIRGRRHRTFGVPNELKLGMPRGSKDTSYVCQFVGYKNSGKTTLICELIPLLKKQGCTVAVIKHDGHEFDIDHPQTDTWKHRQAGASAIAITSGTRTSWIKEQGSSLAELIAAFAGYDYVLVEGFKQELYPKIALIRSRDELNLLSEAQRITAIAYWEALLSTGPLPETRGQAVFNINDYSGIASFLQQQRSYYQNFII